MNRSKIALAAIIVGALILLHQLYFWNRIDWNQILHHENFTLFLWFFAFGVIFTVGWKRFRRAI